jgi:hypothetical protein
LCKKKRNTTAQLVFSTPSQGFKPFNTVSLMQITGIPVQLIIFTGIASGTSVHELMPVGNLLLFYTGAFSLRCFFLIKYHHHHSQPMPVLTPILMVAMHNVLESKYVR